MKTSRIGLALSGVAGLILLSSAIAKIAGVPKMVDGLVHAGIPRSAIVPIALLELFCLALFLIPRTTVFGSFLLTGYFGGAIVTHIIGGESFLPPAMIGLIILIAAYLRVPRLQMLIPLRRAANPSDESQAARHAQPAHG